jgi:multiple sugar transport system permease protein
VGSRRHGARIAEWALNSVLLIVALLMFAPFYWLVATALLPEARAFTLPPIWIPTHPTLVNFAQVFQLIPFGLQILNSVKIATITTAGVLAVSALAAYAFARLQFPGRDPLFVILLSALMVPRQVTAIPIFILLRSVGLLDTHAAIYLPAMISVFGIFLLRQFFLSVPRELDEAAKIDGAGHLGILWHVIVPLCGPALSALAIFTFQASWNDFFWPNIFLFTPAKMTVPVGLVALQGEAGTGPATAVFAAIAMIVVPVLILFVITQRAITQSVAMSGLKG